MTIIEWDDVPIVRQLARENVGVLRANEEGWAQALADAAVSLTQAERDAVLMEAASNRHTGERRIGDEPHARSRLEGQASMQTQTRAQTHAPISLRTFGHAPDAEVTREFDLMREFEQALAPELARASEFERALDVASSSIRERAAALEHAVELERVAALAQAVKEFEPLIERSELPLFAHHGTRTQDEFFDRRYTVARPAHKPVENAPSARRTEYEPDLLPAPPVRQTTFTTEVMDSTLHAVRTPRVVHAPRIAHAAHASHHADHPQQGARSGHVARVVHTARVVHSSHIASVSAPNYAESDTCRLTPDESPFTRSGAGRLASTSMSSSTHKRGAATEVASSWVDGQQPLRALRGATATGRTARTLLASMRRHASHDHVDIPGMALPRNSRAGGPWLRRVTHAYLGPDGVTLWVRDAKLSRANASVLLSELHRWANLAGVKIAAVVCNGKMIYRAAHARTANVTDRATPMAHPAFEVEKAL